MFALAFPGLRLLAVLARCKAHTHRSLTRCASLLTTFLLFRWLILAIVSPVVEYLIRRARPTHGDTLAYDLGIQQFSILTNLLMYGAYATLLVAQLEFSIGLRRVSILLREQKVSGFFEEASRAPHVAGVAAFLVALIISVGDVVCTELYYSGIKAAFLPMQVTALSLHATLCIFSIGTLIYTASQSREVPHARVSEAPDIMHGFLFEYPGY